MSWSFSIVCGLPTLPTLLPALVPPGLPPLLLELPNDAMGFPLSGLASSTAAQCGLASCICSTYNFPIDIHRRASSHVARDGTSRGPDAHAHEDLLDDNNFTQSLSMTPNCARNLTRAKRAPAKHDGDPHRTSDLLARLPCEVRFRIIHTILK